MMIELKSKPNKMLFLNDIKGLLYFKVISKDFCYVGWSVAKLQWVVIHTAVSSLHKIKDLHSSTSISS